MGSVCGNYTTPQEITRSFRNRSPPFLPRCDNLSNPSRRPTAPYCSNLSKFLISIENKIPMR